MATETRQTGQNEAQEFRSKARGAAHDAEQKASETAEKAKQKVNEVGHEAARMAESKMEGRKNRVAEGVHTVGEALRLGAQELRQRGQTDDTEYVDRLASQADRVSELLQQRDTRTMARDVEDFARHNQALFLGGALALGVMGARFLKSSPQHDQQDSRDDGRDPRRLRERTFEPEFDAVGRPEAPGYAPPQERTI